MIESLQELSARAREARKSADLPRMLRDLTVENGPLLQVLLTFIEARDGLVEASVQQDLGDPSSVHQAVRIRGQVQGIDTCLALVHALMAEEPQDEPTQV